MTKLIIVINTSIKETNLLEIIINIYFIETFTIVYRMINNKVIVNKVQKAKL